MTVMHRKEGVSLVELLISLMFFGLFATVLHQFSRTMLRGVRVLEVASEAQEAARIGIQMIVRDLREAGFSPAGNLRSGVREARRDAITIVRDLSGDGDTDDRNEKVGYQLNHEKRALMRTMGNAPPQPMLRDLAADGLEFSYLAADGASLPVGRGGLDDAQRDRVRRIDVRLAIEIKHPNPATRPPIRAAQTASVYLRND